MKLDDAKASKNIEDRRGQRGGKGLAIGGGLGGILMALFAFFVLKQPPQQALQHLAGKPSYEEGYTATPEEEAWAELTAKVLGKTEEHWAKLYPPLARSMQGKPYAQPKPTYEPPTMVWFSGSTSTACGHGAAAMGPFYCPGDDKVYIDLSFFNEMKVKLNAPGDFAQAYVLTHEVGHHVQNLLGLSRFVQAQHPQNNPRASEKEYNQLSVRLELMADFLAGVVLRHTGGIEEGDIEEAINAAHAIGDDTLQKKARGHAVPDSFTHGTSEQRIRWFSYGFKSGDPTSHNTFEVPYEEL